MLLFLVGLLNYTDRYVLAVLIPDIKMEMGLSDTQIGFITGVAFTLFYASFVISIARLADVFGRRAQNRQLETDALEIRFRAERRYRQILTELKADANISRGKSNVLDEVHLNLDDLDTSRNMSSKFQKLAAVPEDKFEGMLQSA